MNLNLTTTIFDVAAMFQENTEVKLSSIRMSLANLLKHNHVQVNLSGLLESRLGTINPGFANNKLYRIDQYIKFSLAREHKKEIEDLLSDPDVLVIRHEVDSKSQELHILYTRQSSINSCLEEAMSHIKQDLEALKNYYAKQIAEEKRKQEKFLCAQEDLERIQELLEQRRA